MYPRFRRRDPQDYAPGQAEGGQYDDPMPIRGCRIPLTHDCELGLYVNSDGTRSVHDDHLDSWLTADGWRYNRLTRARFDTGPRAIKFVYAMLAGEGRLVDLLSKKKAKKMKSKENANGDGT